MNKALSSAAAAAILLTSQPVFAADLDIEIENLSNAIYFTPFLAAAHPDGTALFEVGQPASASIQAMAEGGDISGLVTDLGSIGATVVANPAGGVLAPASSVSFNMNTDGTANTLLTIVSMLLPTNDAFAGLNAIEIPTEPGVYAYNVNAYDAGTEANDEILNGGGAPGTPGMPADPGGLAGTGGTGAASTDANTTVHIHRGALGDTDAAGGPSDLDARVHRWLNPVVRVTVTVN